MGDTNAPNVNKRLRRLKQSNYHQFLVEKNLRENIKLSADYVFDSGNDLLHEAIRVKDDNLQIVDLVLFENYQVSGNKSGYGFGVYGEKSVHRRVRLGAGYADIDRDVRNSDRFGVGRRIYWNGHVTITREFSVAAYVTHGFGTSVKNRVDLVFNYNILSNVRRLTSF